MMAIKLRKITEPGNRYLWIKIGIVLFFVISMVMLAIAVIGYIGGK